MADLAPRVSVVIPTYERRDSVARALRALARQTLPADSYEVVVSVDGSADGTSEMVRELAVPYDVIALWYPNRGRAAACNAGIRAARGELVVLLDDDMEPFPAFIEGHVRAHEGGHRLGVIGAAPIVVDDDADAVVRYVGGKFNRLLETLARPGYELSLRNFYSGNFSARRDLLLEIGMFDEAFTIYGNEDLDLSLRLTRAGARLVFSAEAAARQHYTKSFAALARDNDEKGRTAVLLAEKHPPAYRDLKLSAYGTGSLQRRAALSALLALTRVAPRTSDWVAAAMAWIGKRWPAGADEYYPHALDYFYWVGARAAQRERRSAAPPAGTRAPAGDARR